MLRSQKKDLATLSLCANETCSTGFTFFDPDDRTRRMNGVEKIGGDNVRMRKVMEGFCLQERCR
jgi:hypothetical protein